MLIDELKLAVQRIRLEKVLESCVGRIDCFVCLRITETVCIDDCEVSCRRRKMRIFFKKGRPVSLKLSVISKK